MVDSVGQFIQQLPDLLKALFLLAFPVVNPGNRLYWSYTLFTILVALGVYYLRESKSMGFDLRKALGYCFPKSLYTQRSAILDYQCYLINGLFKIIVSLTAFFTLSEITAHFLSQYLRGWFGPVESQLEVTLTLKVIYTILAVLVLDFSAFFSHYLLHKIPLLWEFHKVHHSAEGLNPMTGFRDHPVDVAFKQIFRALFLGVYMGIFSYCINQEIEAIAIAGLLISTFLLRFVINLRHSHIWISYGWHLNHIFNSPAMHQIHHSKKAEHIDKNFALIFSFWDYLFGTLYVPKVREYFAVGIEQKDYDNIWQLYFDPFVQAYRKVTNFLTQIPRLING
ncbi:MAG: sterol desaturase family protein [Okeania sp. SIO3I5]|uniref:sterol desaturase family protein n=1 Tax=Okeania sp. SIO3I5 TaxID=2607805 RepID=UPI0013B735E0|nr:sterol desaturase family protein [Okeania sp. SIO3I5]NEQ36269.1 sterol desaturase family protein [Okeania sp. SIO3I5]